MSPCPLSRFGQVLSALLALLARLSMATAALLGLSTAGVQAADVGVSISVSQPGVFGRIDIGRFPGPVVVAPQPQAPIYLWVPPGHQKNWRKHCARYGACGAPVYFVQDAWYQQHVHQGPGRAHRGKGHGHGHGHGHGKGRDD